MATAHATAMQNLNDADAADEDEHVKLLAAKVAEHEATVHTHTTNIANLDA